MMSKKIWMVILAAAVLAGCQAGQEKLQTYADDPGYLLRDPHFAGYEQKLREVERRYLAREITYAEYLEQKQELDAGYSGEVQKRETIFSGD
jgi:uncharacterized lipoprotein YmbA